MFEIFSKRKIILIVISIILIVFFLSTYFFIDNYNEILAWLDKADKIADVRNSISLQIVTSIIWFSICILIEPAAIWGFFIFLGVLWWDSIKKGFEESRMQGYRVFSGGIISLFLFIYLNQNSISLTSYDQHKIFILFSIIGSFILLVLSQIKSQALYNALLAFFSSNIILSFVYTIRKSGLENAITILTGFAFGFLFYVIFPGIKEERPVQNIFDKSYNLISKLSNLKKLFRRDK